VLNSTGGEGIDIHHGFTGEWVDDSGLVFLRARYYAPYLNQFIQPDPIVPNPYSPWEWNRFIYSRNNPVNYTDPTGLQALLKFEREEEIHIQHGQDVVANYWNKQEEIAAERAANEVGAALARTINGNRELLKKAVGLDQGDCYLPAIVMVSAERAFMLVYKGPVTFRHIAKWSGQGVFAQTQDRNMIYVFKNYTKNYVQNHPGWVVHELAHAFEHALSPGAPWNSPGRGELPSSLLKRTLSREEDPYKVDPYAGFYGGLGSWQYSLVPSPGEIFADMFLGWVYNRWAKLPNSEKLTKMGQERKSYMNLNMVDWIMIALEW
jgi:RHS repeat-associated protein